MDFQGERAWQELAKAVKGDPKASECLDRLADAYDAHGYNRHHSAVVAKARAAVR